MSRAEKIFKNCLHKQTAMTTEKEEGSLVEMRVGCPNLLYGNKIGVTSKSESTARRLLAKEMGSFICSGCEIAEMTPSEVYVLTWEIEQAEDLERFREEARAELALIDPSTF